MLQHNVYFYLKNDIGDKERAEFLKGLQSLLTIDDMVSGFIGLPSETPDRPVIDKKYHFVLSTVFEDVKQHNRYQEHKTHQEFIKNFKESWKEVKVFDSDQL